HTSHCGGCGNACPAGYLCADGSCVLSCLEGMEECAGSCVDLQSDRRHCGACGNACGPGQVCDQGVCTATCQEGLQSCGGSCVDLKRSTVHCGACNNACGPGEVCEDGACVISCVAGLTRCGATCANLRSDRENCGACGNDCQGRICFRGECLPRQVLSAELYIAAVIRSDGKVVAWWSGGEAILDLGQVASVEVAGSGVIALRTDGTVATWNFPATPAWLDLVVRIGAIRTFEYAIRRDGTLVGWSDGGAEVVSHVSNARDVTGGADFSVALLEDGTVVAWGANTYGQISVPAGLQDVIQVDSFPLATLALRADGTVVGWGNGFIIDWLPGSLANVVQVAAGEGGGVALLADGTVRAWGVSAVVNVPPDLDDVVAIEGGGVFSRCARMERSSAGGIRSSAALRFATISRPCSPKSTAARGKLLPGRAARPRPGGRRSPARQHHRAGAG